MLQEQQQQQQQQSQNHEYDIILKMHTKRDPVWRERAIESLCGTQEQVTSIFTHFQKDNELDMIAPDGTVFGPTATFSTLKDVYPLLRKKYNWTHQDNVTSAFDPELHTKMNSIHKMMFPSGITTTNTLSTTTIKGDENKHEQHEHKNDIPYDDLAIVAGTMFWIRFTALHAKELVSLLDMLPSKSIDQPQNFNFTKGYVENGGVEHAIERLFATEITIRRNKNNNNRKIAEIAPAPRIVALYFPQFHPIPENDKFWGMNFTEWTLLKPLQMEPPLKKPLLPIEEEGGGLGYYDLMSKDTRKAQADMARKYGVNGFIYYHYWFSGSHAPDDHLVMHQVQEQMLLDGEPNLPFAFSWANEPWERKWSGVVDEKENNNSRSSSILLLTVMMMMMMVMILISLVSMSMSIVSFFLSIVKLLLMVVVVDRASS